MVDGFNTYSSNDNNNGDVNRDTKRHRDSTPVWEISAIVDGNTPSATAGVLLPLNRHSVLNGAAVPLSLPPLMTSLPPDTSKTTDMGVTHLMTPW